MIPTKAVFTMLAGVLLAHAQPNPVITYGADARLVVCYATVADRSGYLLTDLSRAAFTVFENGAPQTIKLFTREDVPVSLGLVIDNSASMLSKSKQVAAAALNLVKASNPDDEVFVVNFNEKAYLDLLNGKDFTSDIYEMEAALRLTQSEGGTAMRDAARMSIAHLVKHAHRDKKVLVLLTDGEDNLSKISFDDLVRAAQQTNVVIYTIGLFDVGDTGDRPEKTEARQTLKRLASATGGESYFPTFLTDVNRIVARVARDIRNQYVIGYTSSDLAMDSTYRRIRIAISGPRQATVRTRSGYYATPETPRD
jgi:Ca-activated chloride channel family protein